MTEEQETNRRIISQIAYSYNQKSQEVSAKFHEFDEAYGKQVLAIAVDIEPFVYCKNQNSYYDGPWGNDITRTYSIDDKTVYVSWDCYGSRDSAQGTYDFPLEFLWNTEAIQFFKDAKTKEMNDKSKAEKQKQLEEKQRELNWLKKQVDELEKETKS